MSLELSDVLAECCEKYAVPGASFGIWHQGELQLATYGVLNAEHGAPVLSDSMFQIGSISKVFTATLLMQLVDEGKVELDKPVKHYLADFRVADYEVTQKVTVRHLLNHTSGLAGDMTTDCGVGDDALVRFLDRCALLPNCHGVGEGFSYSNSAFSVLGRLIEVLNGLPFGKVLEKSIIEKLGLTHSLCDVTRMVGKSVSAGHTVDESGRPKPLDTIFTLPAGLIPAGTTLVMSVSDLIEFARAHLNSGIAPNGASLLSALSTQKMQESTVRVPFPARDIAEWGLGWALIKYSNGTLIAHDGATIGQCAYLRLDPISGSIVALFVNGGKANDCMMELFARTYDKLTGIIPNPAPIISEGCPYELNKLAGTYKTVTGEYQVTLKDGQLYASILWRIDDDVMPFAETVPLFFSSDSTFISQPKDGGFPMSFSFMDFSEDGVPQAVFNGLRVINRKD